MTHGDDIATHLRVFVPQPFDCIEASQPIGHAFNTRCKTGVLVTIVIEQFVASNSELHACTPPPICSRGECEAHRPPNCRSGVDAPCSPDVRPEGGLSNLTPQLQRAASVSQTCCIVFYDPAQFTPAVRTSADDAPGALQTWTIVQLVAKGTTAVPWSSGMQPKNIVRPSAKDRSMLLHIIKGWYSTHANADCMCYNSSYTCA